MAEREPLKRIFFCGKVNEKFDQQNLGVYGWVNKKRELGGITFIDLRDREGILQVIVDENFKDKQLVKKIGNEFVLFVKGKVTMRTNPNHEIFTGRVELIAERIEVLAESKVPPFLPEKNREVSEELRFRYRYLDLRNQRLQRNFMIRSKVNQVVMNYMVNKGFLNLETPTLTKATPEGARDYLVPSRVFKGKMFALPQSPQLFKQLFMVAGFERYFQIVKCFRDEDLRADRQPEFTQIDVEMSFTEKEELFEIIEGLIREIFALGGIKLEDSFGIISYAKAMEDYGSDAPDLRIPLKIQDFSDECNLLGSEILKEILKSGGVVKGLVINNAQSFSRKILDNINNYIREIGGKGVIWIKKKEDGFKSSIKVQPDKLADLFGERGIEEDKILLLIGGKVEEVLFQTGKLREFLWKDKLKENNDLKFIWVVDFPLFSYSEEEKRFESVHHPFTSPDLNQLDLLKSDPLKVNSISYDLVLNGVEIGGGSRRINDITLQRDVFRLLNLSEEEIDQKFGFFLKALDFGAPPHLGIALGLDRILMLLLRENSIRDVICYPKTTSSLCLLTGSPSEVSDKQLDELGIMTKKK
jgi:aspartyl-tRNA synthetase